MQAAEPSLTEAGPKEADKADRGVAWARDVPHLELARDRVVLVEELKLLRVARREDDRVRAEVAAGHPDAVLPLAHGEHDLPRGQDLRGERRKVDHKVGVRRNVLVRLDVGADEVAPLVPIRAVDVWQHLGRLRQASDTGKGQLKGQSYLVEVDVRAPDIFDFAAPDQLVATEAAACMTVGERSSKKWAVPAHQ
jgi:hypothetical protein